MAINICILTGRLTRDPEVRYTAGENATAVARFSLAVDRQTKGEKQTDFPNIVVFGKQAENCERYLAKGRKVAINGRIQTGSYTDKEGRKVYTTDVVANYVEFLDSASQQTKPEQGEQVEGFRQADDDIPF